MASIKQAVTLKHRANLGEDAADVEFAAGDPVVILKEWDESYLCRDEAGRLFNIAKALVEPDPA